MSPVVDGTHKEAVSCDTTTFGTTCALRCEIGFEPRTAQNIVCNANGVWEVVDGSALTTCEGVSLCPYRQSHLEK